MTNILQGVSSIDYTFANRNSFLVNGQFSIDMLEVTRTRRWRIVLVYDADVGRLRIIHPERTDRLVHPSE